jgi:hypothetical protein
MAIADAIIYNVIYRHCIGYNNPENDVLRDAFIVTKIVVYFWVGVVLAKKIDNWDLLFKYLKTIALISALYHIGIYIFHYGSVDDLNHLRKETGLQSYVEAVLAGLYFQEHGAKSLARNLSRKFRLFSLQGAILLTSFALYQSRTMLITSLLLCCSYATGLIYVYFGAKLTSAFLELLQSLWECYIYCLRTPIAH